MARRKPPIQANYVPVGVAGGLDAKTDTHVVQQPNTIVASNMRYSTASAIRRRSGTVLGAQPVSGTPRFLGASNLENVCIDASGQLFSYSTASAIWSLKGQTSAYTVQTLPVAQAATSGSSTNISTTNVQVRNVSSAVIGNIGITVWDNGSASGSTFAGSTFISCYDVTSGKQFWQVQCPGTFFSSTQYRILGGTSNSSITSATAQGAMNPVIQVYRGYFVFGMQCVCTGVSDPYTALSGTAIFTQVFYSPACNGITPPVAFDFGASWTKLQSTGSPWFYNILAGTYGTSLAYSGPYHTFDITVNSAQMTYSVVGANYNASNVRITTSMAHTTGFEASHVSSTGATPAPTNCYFNSAIYNTSSGSSPQIGAALSNSGTAYLAITTDRDVHLVNPIALTDNTGTSPTFYGTPLATAIYGSNLLATDGQTTLVYTISGATISALANTYNNFAEGVPTTGLFTGTSIAREKVTSGLYSRVGFISDASGTHPAAWLQAAGNFNCLFLVRLDSATPQPPYARAFYLRMNPYIFARNAANYNTINGYPSVVAPIVGNYGDYIMSLQQLTANPITYPQIVRIPQGVLVTGADTRYYDGSNTRPAGGWAAPPNVQGVSISSTTGGNLVAGQTYTYFFVLADYDAAGNAIYSSPSAPLVCTVAAGQNATTFLPPPIPVGLSNLARLYVYRNCVANLSAYYRVAGFASTLAGAAATNLPINPANNYPTAWTDTTAENCTGNTQLYSPPNGGELPNDIAPPSTCAVATKNRVFVASAEVGSWLYPSKPFYPGRGPEFNAGQYIDVDPSSGPIVGLAAMDENIIVFKGDRIYVMSGTGPDATGNGSFNPPQNVSSDVGLVDLPSVVSTEDGIYFRSTRGLQLLTRAFQLQWVGQNVDPLLSGNTIIASALDPPATTIRFALSNGSVLVYDYTQQSWSVYQYAFGTGNVVNSMAMDPAQTRLWMAWKIGSSTSGLVYEPVVDAASFTDSGPSGNLYNGTVQTAYIPMQGPLGWGRARRCNIYGTVITGGGTITVTFLYDEGMATSSPITYTLPNTPNAPFAVRIRLPRQVCRSVAVSISSAGTTDDCVITGLELETQIKSGAARTADSASV